MHGGLIFICTQLASYSGTSSKSFSYLKLGFSYLVLILNRGVKFGTAHVGLAQKSGQTQPIKILKN